MTDDAVTDRDRLHADYVSCIKENRRADADSLAPQVGLSLDQVDAHFRVADHTDDEWLPDRFDDFAALPPGRFDPRVLDQSTWWVDILRRPHRINDPADFSTEHLHNTIGFLETQGWRWVDVPDLLDDSSVSDDGTAPARYRAALRAAIDATPLMVALRAEANWRNLTTPTA